MAKQIEFSVEKVNHGNWLRISVPYHATTGMTATLQNQRGQILKTALLLTGNNLIDIESMAPQAVVIKIDTPYETLLKEFYLE